jgi:hypothetical protein
MSNLFGLPSPATVWQGFAISARKNRRSDGLFLAGTSSRRDDADQICVTSDPVSANDR